MKKWIVYLALPCLIPAALQAQKNPIPRAAGDIKSLEHYPINFAACPISKCPTGKTCDNGCCIYPTGEAIGQLNYILFNNCEPIKNLKMTFKVTQGLVAEYDNEVSNCSASQVVKKLNSTDGIFIQFNCFSKDAPKALIQYIFAIQGTTITPHIQYAGGTPDKIDHDWQQNYQNAYGLTLPQANDLPAGYTLEVELSTDDNGYVNGATFTVTQADGKVHVQKATKESVFPVRISEFQTNIVSTDGHFVHFGKGGAGTLTYFSSGALCVEGGDYEHCAYSLGDYWGGTCETSNASYGKLSSCCVTGMSFSQSVVVK
jgi:hypothetical protein